MSNLLTFLWLLLALILIGSPLTFTFSNCFYILEKSFFLLLLCLILHMPAIGAEHRALLLGLGSCNLQILLALASWRRPLSMELVLLLILA
jgi:hypothetical protein